MRDGFGVSALPLQGRLVPFCSLTSYLNNACAFTFIHAVGLTVRISKAAEPCLIAD